MSNSIPTHHFPKVLSMLILVLGLISCGKEKKITQTNMFQKEVNPSSEGGREDTEALARAWRLSEPYIHTQSGESWPFSQWHSNSETFLRITDKMEFPHLPPHIQVQIESLCQRDDLVVKRVWDRELPPFLPIREMIPVEIYRDVTLPLEKETLLMRCQIHFLAQNPRGDRHAFDLNHVPIFGVPENDDLFKWPLEGHIKIEDWNPLEIPWERSHAPQLPTWIFCNHLQISLRPEESLQKTLQTKYDSETWHQFLETPLQSCRVVLSQEGYALSFSHIFQLELPILHPKIQHDSLIPIKNLYHSPNNRWMEHLQEAYLHGSPFTGIHFPGAHIRELPLQKRDPLGTRLFWEDSTKSPTSWSGKEAIGFYWQGVTLYNPHPISLNLFIPKEPLAEPDETPNAPSSQTHPNFYALDIVNSHWENNPHLPREIRNSPIQFQWENQWFVTETEEGFYIELPPKKSLTFQAKVKFSALICSSENIDPRYQYPQLTPRLNSHRMEFFSHFIVQRVTPKNHELIQSYYLHIPPLRVDDELDYLLGQQGYTSSRPYTEVLLEEQDRFSYKAKIPQHEEARLRGCKRMAY